MVERRLFIDSPYPIAKKGLPMIEMFDSSPIKLIHQAIPQDPSHALHISEEIINLHMRMVIDSAQISISNENGN